MGSVRRYLLRPVPFRKRMIRVRTFALVFLPLFLLLLGIYIWKQFFLAHSSLVPEEGGIYTEALVGNIKNMNPYGHNPSLFDQDLHYLMYEGLLKYSTISGNIENGLAEFRFGDNSKVYELILKETAQFSDGTPVTIEDVLFTFESIIKNPFSPHKNLRDAFEYTEISTPDERTIVFKQLEQNAYFKSFLTVPILSKKHFADIPFEEVINPHFYYNKHPIGAGPYILKNTIPERDGSVRVFLERNPYYYGKKPYIPQLVFYLFGTKNELLDLNVHPSAYSHLSFLDIPKLEKQHEYEYDRLEFLLPRFVSIFFNLDRPMVGKKFFRESLRVSFPITTILEKGWERVNSPFFSQGIDTDYLITNHPQARQILRKNNFPFHKGKGVRLAGGYKGDPVKLTMITSTLPPVYSRYAQVAKRTWERELGIKVVLKILDPLEFQAALREREYDMVLFGQDFSDNPNELSIWSSKLSEKNNLSNLTNESVDYLIKEIEFSGSEGDLYTLGQKITELIPAITFATPQNALLIDRSVKGVTETFGKLRKWSDRFFPITEWYFREKLTWDIPGQGTKFEAFLKWVYRSVFSPVSH